MTQSLGLFILPKLDILHKLRQYNISFHSICSILYLINKKDQHDVNQSESLVPLTST